MKRSTASRLAWSLACVALALSATTAVLAFLNRAWNHGLDDANPIETLLPIGFAVAGALIASRRRRNPIGWMFLAIAIMAPVTGVATQYLVRSVHRGPLPGAAWVAWVENWALAPVFPTGLVLWTFLLFPDGRFASPRWRALGWIGASWSLVFMVLVWVDPSPIRVRDGLTAFRNPTAIRSLPNLAQGPVGAVAWLGGLLLLGFAAWGVIRRLRRSRGEERQQLKWFAYVVVATVAVVIVENVGGEITGWYSQAAFDATIVLGFGVGIPAACGVAILRHGLYEIDVVIRKTLLYGLLAAFFTVVYAGVVIGVGAAVGSRSNGVLTVVAAVIIALAFQPARQRARHLANRLVYGNRATPYELVSEFSGRLAGAYSTDDVLPRIARMLVEGTGGDRLEIWLRVGGELRPAVAFPDGGEAPPTAIALPPDERLDIPSAEGIYPVRHQGELLGAIAVRKPASDPITPSEDKLLHDIASQAGLVLRNVRLTEELRARLEELGESRRRLVAAQDEERRRLERDTHDGAQQQLVALAVKLRLAETLAPRDPDRAAGLIAETKAELQQAMDDLRDLARGIYPPLLADRGLPAALEAQARKSAVPVTVDPDGVGRYPQEVEAAVYFCCLEALQYVAKYAGATRAEVRLSSSNGELRFEVRDDGRGFDPGATPRGSGLTNMADRLDALGGSLLIESQPGEGMTVVGRVPVTVSG